MAESKPEAGDVVVTLRTMIGAAGTESSLERTPDAKHGKTKDRYNEVVEKIEQETKKTGSEVFVTIQDREASLVQSRMAEEAAAGAALQAGGLEAQFGEGAFGGDIWGWFTSLFDHIDKDEWRDIKRPAGDTPGTIKDTGRVAVVGDWGTNL